MCPYAHIVRRNAVPIEDRPAHIGVIDALPNLWWTGIKAPPNGYVLWVSTNQSAPISGLRPNSPPGVSFSSKHILYDTMDTRDVNIYDLTGRIKMSNFAPEFIGSYSVVYRGSLYGNTVAVKIIKTVGALHTMRRKVMRERTVWEALDHPNILPFYGHADDKTFQPFGAFVSPWYANGDAGRYLERHGRHLTIGQRIELWKGVVRGAAFLHGCLPVIVHGDLKPGNVLIDNDGNPRICDFGLVRIIQEGGTGGMTTTTEHTGTERYLAPELLTRELAVPTTASDVYALGCLGLEFIYSQRPYSHHLNNYHGCIVADIQAGMPPASQEEKHGFLPTVWWDLVESCWTFRPERRPSSSELLVSLPPTPQLPAQLSSQDEGTQNHGSPAISSNPTSTATTRVASRSIEDGASKGETRSMLPYELPSNFITPTERLDSPTAPELLPPLNRKEKPSTSPEPADLQPFPQLAATDETEPKEKEGIASRLRQKFVSLRKRDRQKSRGSTPSLSYSSRSASECNTSPQSPQLVIITSNSGPRSPQRSQSDDRVITSSPVDSPKHRRVIEYGNQAKALYNYNASPDDPNEISFRKGELLAVAVTKSKWWQGRKADGTTGIVPSNYLVILDRDGPIVTPLSSKRPSASQVPVTEDEAESSNASSRGGASGSDGRQRRVRYPYQAMAMYNFTPTDDDSNGLSFRKGEILDVLDDSGSWWKARNGDGIEGEVPAHYLLIVDGDHKPKEDERRHPYKFRTQALYDYIASADDPTELSFQTGEILEVIEDSGNWWKARKSDGTTGIVPFTHVRIVIGGATMPISDELPNAIALYDFNPKMENEIKFSKGNRITNVSELHGGWWVGTDPSGKAGLFPANRVKLEP